MWQERIERCIGFFRIIGERFVKDRFTYSASALTYTTLLSLVPLMAIGLSILSAFPVFSNVKNELQEFIFSNFVPASGDVIKNYLNAFTAQAAKLSIIGTIFLVITSIMLMLTIERALNDVWKVKYRRRGISAWLRYWAILSLGPIFAGLSIMATTYVISMPLIKGAEESLGAGGLLAAILPSILGIVGLTLLYVVIPNCRVPWRYGFVGAVVVGILFEIVKRAFIFYVRGFNTYELLYGALATVPIFLIWVYLSWVIVLFGALVSNVLATGYFLRRGGRIDGFMHAFLWLESLWKAQQTGEGLSIAQLFKMSPGHYEIQPQKQLKILQKQNLISLTLSGNYVLTRDLTQLTLAELYHLLPWRLPAMDAICLPKDSKAYELFQRINQQLDKSMDVSLHEVYQQDLQGS